MPKIFVFGFDATEAAQIRRVRGLIAAGATVSSAMMRRDNMNQDFTPEWPNLTLATAPNEKLGKRLVVMLRSIWKIARHRHLLDGADLILARNFDLLVIAWAGRTLAGKGRVPLVYECLDIHGLFTRADAVGGFARWCERRLLARCAALVVSSPGFIRNYFDARQGYRGKIILLENKLWFDAAPIPRPTAPRVGTPGEPILLGWVGSIRCAPSLALLMAAADALGPAVRIVVRGNVHRHAVPDFDAEIARRDNVVYSGPYRYPDDLAEVYAGCDLVWAQDLWQRGGNSDWLLPNRIYEASYFGCPSIAVADTETGRRVADGGLGFTIPRPEAGDLIALLASLDRATIQARAQALLDRDASDFRLLPADYVEAFAPLLPEETAAPGNSGSFAKRNRGTAPAE